MGSSRAKRKSSGSTGTTSRRRSTRGASKTEKGVEKAEPKKIEVPREEEEHESLYQAYVNVLPLVEDPLVLVSEASGRVDTMKASTKLLYDYSRNDEASFYAKNPELMSSLPELLVDGFDSEQLWEQLQLHNVPLTDHFELALNQMLVSDDEEEEDSDNSDAMDLEDQESEEDDEEDFSDEDGDADDMFAALKKHKGSEEDEEGEDEEGEGEDAEGDEMDEEEPMAEGDDDDEDEFVDDAGIEDRFLKLSELEAFSDKRFDESDSDEEEEDDDEEVDLDDLDKQARSATYADFFDPPSAKTDDGSFEEEIIEEDESGNPTSYEKQLALKQQQISELEAQITKGRDWDQMGEVNATARPADSLLEKHVEFEFVGQMAPVITKEATLELEDVIKQRIIDNMFDDVERKIEVKEKEYKPKRQLSQEKSELGLAEVYEREYVNKVLKDGDEEADLREELNEEHAEIATMFANLCFKLDALSNFHFTPKPIREDATIRSNTPAISMEEVLPMHVSDAQGLAPQEVYKSAQRGMQTSREEMSREEKQARRRLKKDKKKKRAAQKALEMEAAAKTNKSLAEKMANKRAASDIKHMKNVTSASATDNTDYRSTKEVFQKVTAIRSGVREPSKKDKEKEGRKASSFML